MDNNEWADGGWVTFTLQVTVPGLAANPEFTRDDVVAHATSILSDLGDYAQSEYAITIAAPYEVASVEAR